MAIFSGSKALGVTTSQVWGVSVRVSGRALAVEAEPPAPWSRLNEYGRERNRTKQFSGDPSIQVPENDEAFLNKELPPLDTGRKGRYNFTNGCQQNPAHLLLHVVKQM